MSDNEPDVKVKGFDTFLDDQSVLREEKTPAVPIESKDLLENESLEEYLEKADTQPDPPESDPKLKEMHLEDYYIHNISGISDLKPMVVHVEAGDETTVTDQMGIPGFYDDRSETFFLLDGTPVPAKMFDEKFKHFLRTINPQ